MSMSGDEGGGGGSVVDTGSVQFAGIPCDTKHGLDVKATTAARCDTRPLCGCVFVHARTCDRCIVLGNVFRVSTCRMLGSVCSGGFSAVVVRTICPWCSPIDCLQMYVVVAARRRLRTAAAGDHMIFTLGNCTGAAEHRVSPPPLREYNRHEINLHPTRTEQKRKCNQSKVYTIRLYACFCFCLCAHNNDPRTGMGSMTAPSSGHVLPRKNGRSVILERIRAACFLCWFSQCSRVSSSRADGPPKHKPRMDAPN